LEEHCSEEVLSAYLDGDLGSEAAGRAAEHLAECEVCRRSLAQIRSIRDAAAGMEQPAPPDRMWGAVQERIRASRARGRRLARLCWLGVPALAATVLVVVLAGRVRKSGLQASGMAAATSGLTQQQAAEETAREYREYVRGIDRAVDECRAALDENPGNVRVRTAYTGARSSRQSAMDRLVSGGDW
jgi:anti-sigma factor RsiW